MKKHAWIFWYEVERGGKLWGFYRCTVCDLVVSTPFSYEIIEDEIVRKMCRIPSRTDCDIQLAKKAAQRLLGKNRGIVEPISK